MKTRAVSTYDLSCQWEDNSHFSESS